MLDFIVKNIQERVPTRVLDLPLFWHTAVINTIQTPCDNHLYNLALLSNKILSSLSNYKFLIKVAIIKLNLVQT